jgi:phosphoglycerate dehydrogenase-like enzyme
VKPNIVIAHVPKLKLLRREDYQRLGRIGTVLNSEPIGDWSTPQAGELLSEADVVLGHWGCPRLTAQVLAGAPRLKMLAYGAGSLKTVVSDALFDLGVAVTSCSDANAEPVAEFTLAAILMANKDVFWRRDVQRDPELAIVRQSAIKPPGNWNKTVGIVGASRVGRKVIELLWNFPHLDITVYDPFLSGAEAEFLGATKMELDELCATADVLSIHAPDLASTFQMIGAEQLALLPTGATVINTARGRLIDHYALHAELQEGRLYAVLDVTDPEPLPEGHPIHGVPNVFLTPHLAGSQGTENGRLVEWAIDEIERFVEGRAPRNPVTKKMLETMA